MLGHKSKSLLNTRCKASLSRPGRGKAKLGHVRQVQAFGGGKIGASRNLGRTISTSYSAAARTSSGVMEAPSRHEVMERRTGQFLSVEFSMNQCCQKRREIAAAVELLTGRVQGARDRDV
jgi:hypothetical protein